MKKFINQDDMKQVNASDVFNLIKELKSVTRKQIETITGLSWGAVSNITARLLENDYIAEKKSEEGTGAGRTPFYLEVNTKRYFVLGLDINITGIKAELVNLKSETVQEWSCDVEYENKETLLNCIFYFLRKILDEISYEIISVGIAMQGVVDTQNGISLYLPQCKGWHDVPLAELLEKEFNIPVYIEHDPNCILLAETVNRDFTDAVLFRIDRGIGMAVMLNGKILNSTGILEIGHTTVVPDGIICSCGNSGCLEAYASENGMEKLAGIPFEKITDKVKDGDVSAQKLFDDMAMYLGISINNVLRIFNANQLLLCGDMMRYKELFLDKLEKRLRSDTFRRHSLEISIIDVESAMHGAVLIAIEKSTQNLRV